MKVSILRLRGLAGSKPTTDPIGSRHAGSLSTTASSALSERHATSHPRNGRSFSFFNDRSDGFVRPTRNDPLPRLEITASEAPSGEICPASTPWPALVGVASWPSVLHRAGLDANGTVATNFSSPKLPGDVVLAAETSKKRPSDDHPISGSVQPGTDSNRA